MITVYVDSDEIIKYFPKDSDPELKFENKIKTTLADYYFFKLSESNFDNINFIKNLIKERNQDKIEIFQYIVGDITNEHYPIMNKSPLNKLVQIDYEDLYNLLKIEKKPMLLRTPSLLTLKDTDINKIIEEAINEKIQKQINVFTNNPPVNLNGLQTVAFKVLGVLKDRISIEIIDGNLYFGLALFKQKIKSVRSIINRQKTAAKPGDIVTVKFNKNIPKNMFEKNKIYKTLATD